MITRRREFLVAGAFLGMSGLAGRTSPASEEAKPARKNEPKSSSAEEDVSAVEDLMRNTARCNASC